ncbi:hypothetical protein DFH09DRAFT_1125523 [Mycena vulgaris]|nr:hypothetical protein DFH09DRAFT_1125523 [Mycena vulgaris]
MSVLAADRARITAAEAQILDLQRSIHQLRARLDSYKYPVLTLPNEIVSEIFIHFLPVYPLCPPLCGPLSPNLLTQICRKWRDIALATPQLWRAVCIRNMGNDAFGRQIEMVESWLNRSASCPLSIRMDEDTIAVLPIDDVLDVIVPHYARWEHVKLLIDSVSYLPVLEGPMPFLRQLYLTVDGVLQASSAVSVRQAPLLRAVTLDNSAYTTSFLPNVGFLPWSQLTSLTLIVITPTECWPILQQSANLVHCELVIWGDDVPQPPVTIPRLESLVFWAFGGFPPMTQSLDTFIVPALRTLQIPEEFLGMLPVQSLTSFIAKSGCNLQKVRITGGRDVKKRLYRRSLPSVPKFVFNGSCLYEKSDEGYSDVESDSGSDPDE